MKEGKNLSRKIIYSLNYEIFMSVLKFKYNQNLG